MNNLHQTETEFNCGIDLHAKSMYICVMNRDGEILVHRNIRNNDFAYFLKVVEPYRHDLTVACECTFNWYWLCDDCYDAKIRFVLGHALYMRIIHSTISRPWISRVLPVSTSEVSKELHCGQGRCLDVECK